MSAPKRTPPHPNPLPKGAREPSPLPSGERKASQRAVEGAYKPKPPKPMRSRAKALRRDATDVEKKLWQRLRNRQMQGFKFRRQHPLPPFILDFACEEEKLGIELDGGQHNEAENIARDAARSALLATSGWRIMRFWNNEVNENIEGVLQVIADALTRKRPQLVE